MNSFEDLKDLFQERIVKGNVISIGDRKIYPIIQIFTMEMDDTFWYESITPLGLAVTEPGNKYIVPFFEEDEKVNELLKKDELWDELGIKI